MISNYDKSLEGLEKKDYEDIWERARVYNTALKEVDRQFINGKSEDEHYLRQLKVDNNMMGYLQIEKIGVSLPIYHGTSENILQVGVGHLEGSELPTGDVGNHTVLTGHRGLPSAKLFTDLDKLIVGDQFTLSILDKQLTYRVGKISIVEPEQVDALHVEPGEDLVTLVTCTPYGINSHRLLIQGVRVEGGETLRVITEDAEVLDSLMLVPLVAIPLLAVLLIIVLITTKKTKK